MLVGAHGAGMTNMIFMPRNSLIVELTGEWDGRMLPVCGYHGPLCAACGHHHYIHHYDWDGQGGNLNSSMNIKAINPLAAARSAFDMYYSMHFYKKKPIISE